MPVPPDTDAVLERPTNRVDALRRPEPAVTASPVAHRRNAAAAVDALSRAVVPDQVVREFVDRNSHLIFPDADAKVDVVEATLGPASYFQEERFGRWLDIRYRDGGRLGSLKLWLKYSPGLAALFPLLADYHRRLDGRVFPRPYFAWQASEHGPAGLATAFVGGPTLLNRVRGAAVSRRIAPVEAVFRSNGEKMRAFHDVSAALGGFDTDAMIGTIVDAIAASRHLTALQRDTQLAHVAATRQVLASASVPMIRTHNDWVLRNIIVAADRSDYVIDTDDLQASPQCRWHDIGLFLLDVETQLKWFPLITPRLLARLWRAFWSGYSGDRPLPEALPAAQRAALLYLVRVQWLVEGVLHKPHFDMLSDGRLRNVRIRRWLKRGVLRGRHSLLDLPTQ